VQTTGREDPMPVALFEPERAMMSRLPGNEPKEDFLGAADVDAGRWQPSVSGVTRASSREGFSSQRAVGAVKTQVIPLPGQICSEALHR